MVMEETPSPHIVGREFVRQYYTLLNQAPMHLHRFYNENSSFVHGGLDTPNRETEPVIGQRHIHHRIQQLDFNDCHAKIRQVDSQATLGNGVVVQVTGELSNNGEPMRRFTQTFVLAQQSPKKYYVHNDIFRYQDEMINDEESDAGIKDVDDDLDTTSSQTTRSLPPSAINNFYPPGTQTGSILINGGVEMISQHLKSTNLTSAPHMTDSDNKQQRLKAKPEAPEVKKITEAPVIKQITENIMSEPVSKGPKTYATLVKSGGTVPTSFANIMSAAAQVLPVVDATSYPPIQGKHSAQQPPREQPQQNKPHPHPKAAAAQSQMAPPKSKGRPSEERKESGDVDKRRLSGGPPSATYPDSQQIFVGNVPLSASEQDIKDIFSKYGTVVDLRLNCKAPAKGQPGKIFPKYGFVIFSDAAAVKLCMQAKPITMPGDSSHCLNIEEKRNRFRSGEDRPGGGSGGGRGMGRAGGGGPPTRRSNEGGGRGRGTGRMGGLDNKGGGMGGRGGGAGGGSGGGGSGGNGFTSARR